MSDENTAPEADETESEALEASDAASSEASAEEIEAAPEEAVEVSEEPAITGDHPRKPDASPSALEQLLLTGEHITSELLDEIEKRCDVSDIRYLVEFCRRLLGAQEG